MHARPRSNVPFRAFSEQGPGDGFRTNQVARVAFWATEPPDVARLLGGLQRDPVVLVLDPEIRSWLQGVLVTQQLD